MTEYKMVKLSEIKENAALIDVRTTIEHQSQHLLSPHDNIPLDQLDPKSFAQSHNLNQDDEIYIICRSGIRSKTAADKFYKEGYKNIYVIDGGIMACEKDGESVFTAQNNNVKFDMDFLRKLPIERQVRLVAGGLVALSILLGGFLHSVFYLVALIVGGGLIYSALTGSCAMAMMLSKAPWNKAPLEEKQKEEETLAKKESADIKLCDVNAKEKDSDKSVDEEKNSQDKKSA